MTYYEILEISEKASQEVIRMAYKALCKKYHPDVYRGDKSFAEEKMKEINEAYEILSDEKKKRQYDYSFNRQAQYTQKSYYEPKQEHNPVNIALILSFGFIALEKSDWLTANAFFEQVLSQDSANAEAYLGKLMVELKVKTREELKNCSESFNYKTNYKKAYFFGDEALKQFLQETIQFINKRNYENECRNTYYKACSLMNNSTTIQGFKDAIARFEKIRNYKDSNEKIKECYKKIAEINYENQRRDTYYNACYLMKQSKSVEDFNNVISEFEKIQNYKDANKKIEECYKKIAEINSKILAKEAKRTPSVLQEISEQGNTHTKTFGFKFTFNNSKVAIASISLVVVIVIVSLLFLPKNNFDNENSIKDSSSEITSSKTDDINDSTDNLADVDNKEESNDKNTNPNISKPNTVTVLPSNPTSSNPTSSNPTPSAPTLDKPEIFGDGSQVKISEGDFTCFLNYSPFEPTKAYAVVIEYTGTSNVVNIPSTIKGHPVKEIGNKAFKNCELITSVTIPDGVTSIGVDAFYHCKSLRTIIIPDTVENIWDYAFSGCTSLKTITMPNTLQNFGESVFSNCESLVSIKIPNGVKIIDYYTFENCKSLTSIILPNTLTKIGYGVFTRCNSLKSIIIPNNVTTIGTCVFQYCPSLETLVIPEGVESIGGTIVWECKSLISITIPDSVIEIDSTAFMGCQNLKTVNFDSESQKSKFSHLFDYSVELKVIE